MTNSINLQNSTDQSKKATAKRTGERSLKFKINSARKFLRMLDPHAGAFSFRTYTDDQSERDRLKRAGKPDPLSSTLKGPFDGIVGKLTNLNRQGAAVCVVVNDGGQRDESISRVRAVFADFDNPAASFEIPGIPKPHIVVASSKGKKHAYWLVENMPTEVFAKVQKAIAERCGSDPCVTNLSRVMRLPGFWHRKGNPIRVRLLKARKFPPYSADHIRKVFPTRAAHAGKAKAAKLVVGSDMVTKSDPALLTLTLKTASYAESAGVSRDSALRAVRENLTPDSFKQRVSDKEIARAYDGAVEKLRAGKLKPADGIGDTRVPIEFDKSQVHQVVDEAESALRDTGVPIYRRGTQLVHPEFNPATGLITKLAPVTADWLHDRLRRVARCTVSGGGAIDWPTTIPRSILARAGEAKFPALRGLIQVPLLRDTGKIRRKAGYDARSNRIVAIRDGWPVPKRPTRGDAECAIAKLRKFFSTFPFVAEVDASVVYSAVLTCIARPLLRTAPMHAITAPIAGSGKSKIADICSILATGSTAEAIAWSPKPDEAEKRLASALLAGRPIVSFDNVQEGHELCGDLLCSLLTQDTVDVRILGKSKTVSVPVSITLLANGNNLVITGDTTRRALIAEIDPKVERPELRQFKVDPVAAAIEQREELVNAALTVLSAYLRCGAHVNNRVLGSFEQWSHIVGGALVWLGCADPAMAVDKLRDKDPAKANLRALMHGWQRNLGGKRARARDLIQLAEKKGDLMGVLESVATGPNGKLSPIKLGKFLRGVEGRIVDDHMFKPVGNDRTGVQSWKLVEVRGSAK